MYNLFVVILFVVLFTFEIDSFCRKFISAPLVAGTGYVCFLLVVMHTFGWWVRKVTHSYLRERAQKNIRYKTQS